MTPEEQERAVGGLTALLEAIDRGEVDSNPTLAAYLTGARDSAAMIVDEWWFPPRPTSGRRHRS